jgi:hypothetical protein
MTTPRTDAGRALLNGMRDKFAEGTLGRQAADKFGPALAEVEDEAALRQLEADLHDSEPLALLRALVEANATSIDDHSNSFGCPGEDQYGVGHDDVVHVAPYHCAPDACDICAAQADARRYLTGHAVTRSGVK